MLNARFFFFFFVSIKYTIFTNKYLVQVGALFFIVDSERSEERIGFALVFFFFLTFYQKSRSDVQAYSISGFFFCFHSRCSFRKNREETYAKREYLRRLLSRV